MKTLKTILKQKPVYLHCWNNKIDVIGDFENIYMTGEEYYAKEAPYKNVESWLDKKRLMGIAIEKYKNIKILFASYGRANYSGDAFVLFYENNKLFEVNGGHCSCNGLENQWHPEETTLDVLKHRLLEGKLGRDSYSDNEFSNELKEFIGVKEQQP